MNVPIKKSVLLCHEITDTANAVTAGGSYAFVQGNPNSTKSDVDFVVSPSSGLWERKASGLRPAMDMGMWLAEAPNNRMTVIDGTGFQQFLEYSTLGNGSSDAVAVLRTSDNRMKMPTTLAARTGATVPEIFLVHCYVRMPPKSVVNEVFSGWKLTYSGGAHTSARSKSVYTDPLGTEDVSISLTTVVIAATTDPLDMEFKLYYTADGTQVTDPRDGSKAHRISVIRLSHSR